MSSHQSNNSNSLAKNIFLFAVVLSLIIATGVMQSWNLALTIVNMGIISAILALGVNLQWGYAGIFNVGIMGFIALGGLAAVLVAIPPVEEAWNQGFFQGGMRIIFGLLFGACTVTIAALWWKKWSIKIYNIKVGAKDKIFSQRTLILFVIIIAGYTLFRYIIIPPIVYVGSINPSATGNIGGLNLPIIFSWPLGGVLAGAVAYLIGKVTLGLRSDYLAIATLGISEIIIAILKNEAWLARGVKNVVGLPRPYPIPFELELQSNTAFVEFIQSIGGDPVSASSVVVKLMFAAMFIVVLLILLWLAENALKSPWGRMVRAIRDNEVSASAMGKNVTARHLQIFILGSAICGIAGAMMITLDGQLTPSSYNPLRFTFLIWVMVIIGGSGNNWGSILGGMIIWFLWVQVEPLGLWLMKLITIGMADGYWLKTHLINSAAHMRLLTMGMVLLLVLRFYPKGLIPEK